MGGFAFKSFKQEAKTEQEKEMRKMVEKAFKEGEKKGLLDGEAIGYEKGKKDAEKEFSKNNSEILEMISNNINSIAIEMKNCNSNFEKNLKQEFNNALIQIIQTFFEKIAHTDFSEDIVKKVDEFFEKNIINQKLTIEVHESLKEKLEEHLNQKLDEEIRKIIVIKGNQSCSQYDLKIFNQNGIYERNLKEVKEKFQKMLNIKNNE